MNDPQRVYEALRAFGAPLVGVSLDDFSNPNVIIQIGVPLVRVDLLLDLEGIAFAAAWQRRQRAQYGETPIHVLGRADLVRSKQLAGRAQDLVDLEKLTRTSRKKSTPKRR